jgi:hypothetical protein
MAGFRIEGDASGQVAEVNSGHQLMVATEPDAGSFPERVGCIRAFSEVDPGSQIGHALLRSGEVDIDYRQRVGLDVLLDSEQFFYTAQNTGKHRYGATTQTITWSANGVTLNGGGIATANTNCGLGTYAMFPTFGSGALYVEQVVAFTAQPTANVIVEFGVGIASTVGNVAPSDGCFFRLTSAGISGVVSFSGSETTTSVFAGATYANNEAKKYGIVQNQRTVEFWIDDVLHGVIKVPTAGGVVMSSASGQWFIQQRHPGAAGGVLQTKLFSYTVALGGLSQVLDFNDVGNAMHGAYQGLSGHTMGSLAQFANNANPTAAVPTNTTAALGTGLGGQFWETDTLAVTTDGIICSYLNPAGSVAIPGRRLVINGVKIESFVQTALTGGGYNAVWSLAFGHNALSLATVEGIATKAPRRIPLGNQAVASGAAALTALQTVQMTLNSPVVVNPGEYVACVKKKVGTAPSAGVIAHTITFDARWI